MASNQAYTISKNSTWPTETYSITLDNTLINPALDNLPASNYFRYISNFMNDVYKQSTAWYSHANTKSDNFGLYSIDTFSDTTLYWDVSAYRKNYNIGNTFNFFQLNVNPGNAGNNMYYGYTIYPSRLILYPTANPTFDGTNWTLTTQTKLTSPTYNYYYSRIPSKEAATDNINYLNTSPTTESLISDSNYSIVYNMCACRIQMDRALINYTDTYNPVYLSTLLETSPTGYDSPKIRPDSTVITFETSYYSPTNDIVYLGQERPDSYSDYGNNDIYTLDSTYILNQDTTNKIQTFQLIQKSDAAALYDLGDSRYCVLSCVLNLNNTNFKYFSNNFQGNGLTIVNNLTGIPFTYLGVSYIADCATFKFSNQTWQSTVVSAQTSNGTNLGSAVATNTAGATNMTWVTQYPPHYYSYKANVYKNTAPSNILETANLTFYVYSSAVDNRNITVGNITTTYVILSTFITSDHNIVNYDLSVGNTNDYIKFTPIGTPTPVLSSLVCTYGNLLSTYSLLDSPWIPAYLGKDLKINYPLLRHGEIRLSIRPTLSTVAGYFDAYQATPIILGANTRPTNRGQKINISKIYEAEDFMEVDASYLTSDLTWPSKDLRNSYISWSFTPNDSNISLNAIDLSGNFIQVIPKLSAVMFSPNTATIRLSGYGPQTATLILSSQKYNQTASMASVSSFFNFYSQKELLVGSTYLDNSRETRTLKLTAAIPYKGRVYPLPPTSILNWTWSYDANTDYENIPVNAFYDNDLNQKYTYGLTAFSNTLSSINFKLVPPYSLTGPNYRSFIATASIDTSYGSINGTYQKDFDDFPHPSIFNTDFKAYYTAFTQTSATILRTRDKQYTITRPNLNINKYIFVPEVDVSSRLSNSTLLWNISTNTGFTSTTGNGLNPQFFSIYSQSKSIITLKALSALAPGWSDRHYIETSITLYVVDPIEFYTPMSLIVYPEYFWTNGRYLTLSDTSNYTFAVSPTAYANKKSNSQAFWLSASKPYFSDYRYSVDAGKNIRLNSVFSDVSLVNLPYTNQFFSDYGLTISLTAFNSTTYPPAMGTSCLIPVSGVLYTTPFPNTTQTIDFSGSDFTNSFSRSPKLIPYTDNIFSFSVLNTSMAVDSNRIITINQTVTASSPNTPVLPDGGTITYTLSSPQWVVSKDIQAVTGSYDVFELKIGDAFNPLYINGTSVNTLYLTASASINAKIPSSTFDNVSYSGDTDLWRSVPKNVTNDSVITIFATATAVAPEIYLSTTYLLTGTPLIVEYATPKSSNDFYVIAYITDFGETKDSIRVSYFDSSLVYQYKTPGIFYISYSAIYNDGSVEFFEHPNPVIVKDSWETYDPNKLRFVEETILTLPYTEDETLIQPNEWGDADIFNTCVTRLQDNIDYIENNLITLNTQSPTVYFGWLGCQISNLAEGVRWYTKDYGSQYYLTPSLSVPIGKSYFKGVKDVIEREDYMFVLEGTTVRCFSAGRVAQEIPFVGMDDATSSLLNPYSIEIDDTGTLLFVSDPPNNKIYRIDLELYGDKPIANLAISVGGLGRLDETNRFSSPNELAYAKGHLYVLDYNNRCIKEYNNDLAWSYTYYNNSFAEDKPLHISVHPEYNLLYVLTQSQTIHVFDRLNSVPISKFKIPQTSDGSEIQKIFLDEVGDFFYVVTEKNVYKYSYAGYHITKLDLPQNTSYIGGKRSLNRSLLLLNPNYIAKIQDVLTIHTVGEGLPLEYWSKDQLMLGRDEFAYDFNYNRSLLRLTQNIKMFRSSLNAKLVLTTEQSPTSVVTYFSIVPLSTDQLPLFDDSIENESIGVGTNELHTPQTINKELMKLYQAISDLKDLMDIREYNTATNTKQGCSSGFCWSWKALSCFNLTLPIIKICSINPITYAELETGFPETFAPTNTWAAATSKCCNKYITPV